MEPIFFKSNLFNSRLCGHFYSYLSHVFMMRPSFNFLVISDHFWASVYWISRNDFDSPDIDDIGQNLSYKHLSSIWTVVCYFSVFKDLEKNAITIIMTVFTRIDNQITIYRIPKWKCHSFAEKFVAATPSPTTINVNPVWNSMENWRLCCRNATNRTTLKFQMVFDISTRASTASLIYWDIHSRKCSNTFTHKIKYKKKK